MMSAGAVAAVPRTARLSRVAQLLGALACVVFLLTGCQTVNATDPGRAIVVDGQRFAVDATVVTWSDRGGYNAYHDWLQTKGHFNDRTKGLEEDSDLLKQVRADGGWTLDTLRQRVDRVVVHYDATGLSRECFRVLEQRELSCHFLIDLDGTIYQTLDIRHRAWHAGTANSRSVGIEIANLGAYDVGQPSPLARWYRPAEGGGTRIVIPLRYGDGGLRNAEYVPTPARPNPIVGSIQGRTLEQYDFTDAQYRSLAALLAGLHEALPAITLDAPRDADGAVIPRLLTESESAGFAGVVGHYHVSAAKVDPGPAFDWGRALGLAKAYASGHQGFFPPR